MHSIKNNFATRLTEDITSSQLTMKLDIDPSLTYPYWLTIGKDPASGEIVEITGKTGSDFTIARGTQSTIAQAFPAHTRVQLLFTKGHVDEMQLLTLEATQADWQTEFETSEATRESTFNAAEAARQSEIDSLKQQWQDEFDVAETARQTEFEATKQVYDTAEAQRETAFAGMVHVDANLELSEARNGESTLKARLDKSDSSFNAHLAENAQQISDLQMNKAEKTEVNTLATAKADTIYVDTLAASLASGSPKGTYATPTDLQTAKPTGDTNIYVVTTDGNWYYWNGSAWTAGGVYQSSGITDKSVTPEKTSFFNIDRIGKNIFFPGGVTEGKYLNPSNGAYAANASFLVCETYYEVKENIAYCGSLWKKADNTYYTRFTGIVVFYDANKQYLSGQQMHNTDYGVFTTPANCKYFRISDTISAYNTYNYQFELTWASSAYVPYTLRKSISPNYVNVPITITVKKDGTGDFTSIRSAIESITDSSEDKQYIVEVYTGTYNLEGDYTAEELSSAIYGIVVPDFTTLRGIGNRDEIIISMTLATNSDTISTLNFNNTSGLENVTVKGEHTRYVVHDDFADNGNEEYKRTVKNCVFIGKNLRYDAVYGSGSKQGADWYFENCIFDASAVYTDKINGIGFLNHNNTNWTRDSKIKFVNCRFKTQYQDWLTDSFGLQLRSLNTNANNMPTHVYLYGCDCNGIVLREENAAAYGSGILHHVRGFYNTNTHVKIVNTDGKDYSKNVDLI